MTSCDRPRVWVKVPTVRGEAEAYRAGGRSAGARATRSHPARCHRLRRASPRAIPVPPQRERPDTEWDPITPLITLLEVRGHRHACRTREAIAWNTVPGSPKKRSASTDVDSAHSPGLSPAASGYEFNHRTGPGLTQMPGCRIRAAAPPTGRPPVPGTDPPPPAHSTALGHRYGGMGAHAAAAVALRPRQSVFVRVRRRNARGRSRSQGGGPWASMTVIQEREAVRLRRAGTSGMLPIERQISYFRHVGYDR